MLIAARGQAECKAATRLRDRFVCAYMRVSAHATRARAGLPRFEPAGLSALSKVASRSLSGLTRHADGRWALLMCFLERLSILSFL